ncbi:OmpW/AlkL family protein [Burkholderia ambifaria]|uniref:OmpW/AlkL family protein n=1 Tax=Burkholderia ambifaria TaxID=152480 RepID=UPI000F80A306|nr:OmpW family outer membrane protein [Burkholderia ambifaria]
MKFRALLFVLFVGVCRVAAAQTAGDVVATVGGAWMNFSNSSSGQLVSSSQFGTFPSPGTSAEIHNTFTAGLLLDAFVTDHIAAEVVLAYPPTLNVYAQGNAAPLGSAGPQLPLGALRPLASARAWPATVQLKYNFMRADANFRPYVGVGVNYTWYTNIKINSTFNGAAQSFAGPGGSVQSSLSNSWNPVVSAGFTYKIAQHWFANGMLMYIPLKTNATINSVAADGTVTLSNKMHIKADPLIAFVGVGYRF